MNEATQIMENFVSPLVPTGKNNPEGAPGATQLLDASTYASKSFYDPVHKQQVWTSWVRVRCFLLRIYMPAIDRSLSHCSVQVHERFMDSSHGCINATVCNTHTLPRALIYDPEIKAHITPPVPQTDLLRCVLNTKIKILQ